MNTTLTLAGITFRYHPNTRRYTARQHDSTYYIAQTQFGQWAGFAARRIITRHVCADVNDALVQVVAAMQEADAA